MTYQKVSVKELMFQEEKWVDKKVTITGFVHAVRTQGAKDDGVSSFGFASVMDSSSVKHMQVIMNLEKCISDESRQSMTTALKKIKKGSPLSVSGTIVACPESNSAEQKQNWLRNLLMFMVALMQILIFCLNIKFQMKLSVNIHIFVFVLNQLCVLTSFVTNQPN